MWDRYTRVCSTADAQRADRIGQTLSQNGIACKIKRKTASNRSPFDAARLGSAGSGPIRTTYSVYVKKADEELALHLIRQSG